MGDLVNLNRYRKSKLRQAGDRRAAINREKFGRSKADAERDSKLRGQGEKSLDDKKLEGPDEPA
jgi:hypothetical protein